MPKANRKDHLVENLGAFDFSLSGPDMETLDAFNEQYSSLGSTLQYL